MSEPAPPSVPSPHDRGAGAASSGAVPSTAEVAVGLVLTAGLAVLSFVVGALAMLFAMVSDGCFGEPDDPRICSDSGSVIFFLGLFGLWAVLALGVVGSLVMILLGRRRRRRVWFWPFVGLGVGVVGVVAFFGVIAYLAS